MYCSGKGCAMKKVLCILLFFAGAMMLFPFTCACADLTDGLIYDETDIYTGSTTADTWFVVKTCDVTPIE